MAAGRGQRLDELWPDRPKGFLELGGRTLVERSLDALRERGVRRIVIVAGYCADEYRRRFASAVGMSWPLYSTMRLPFAMGWAA